MEIMTCCYKCARLLALFGSGRELSVDLIAVRQKHLHRKYFQELLLEFCCIFLLLVHTHPSICTVTVSFVRKRRKNAFAFVFVLQD